MMYILTYLSSIYENVENLIFHLDFSFSFLACLPWWQHLAVRKSSDTYNLLQTDTSQRCYRCIPISLSRLRTPSRLGARLDWHRNSILWFPAPNAPIVARISPMGFHRTKESCQRSRQRVTSPSATAVMFPLLLTYISPFFSPFSKPLLTLDWAGDFLPERFKLSFFLNTHIKARSKGGGKRQMFLLCLSTQVQWSFAKERESERGVKRHLQRSFCHPHPFSWRLAIHHLYWCNIKFQYRMSKGTKW